MTYTYYRKMIIGLLTCVILLGLTPLKSIAASQDKVDRTKIDDYVASQMKQTHIPGLAIGIVKGNQTLYIKGYGDADTGRKVTGQTPFEIGSVSKSFTALAIMQLVEKGFINLHTPVDKYLPWFKVYYENKSATITVRQLLNQNSGVPTFFDNDTKADVSIEQVSKENLNNLKLVNKPGTSFLYSNANYIILGEVVQAVSKQSYQDYVQKNILTPLEMKHSYMSKKEAQKYGLAAGYRTWFGLPVKSDLAYFIGNIPCGHIISCAEDMCHYLSAMINDGKYKNSSILSPDGMKILMEPAVQTLVPMGTDATACKYAMGWGINYKNDKIDAVEHTGETSNYHAHAIMNPNNKTAVIEMDNVGGYITAGQIAPGVLKIMQNKQLSTSINSSNVILIMNIVYLLIMILLILSFLRLKNFSKRITKSKKRLIFNLIFACAINILLPFIFFFGGPTMLGASWNACLIFSPDITFVLIATSIVLFVIGILKLIILVNTIAKKRNILNSMYQS